MSARDYYFSGANRQQTLEENTAAFRRSEATTIREETREKRPSVFAKIASSSARSSRRLSRFNRNDTARTSHRLSYLRRPDGNTTDGSPGRRNRHSKRYGAWWGGGGGQLPRINVYNFIIYLFFPMPRTSRNPPESESQLTRATYKAFCID